jgi:ppGpp synthetase/RelA/SpoT-type nucleotidyltranferase
MSDPFKEMFDIVGLRVICLFQSDINKVNEVIRKTFRVIKEDNKVIEIPKDVFNFAETHFDITLLNTPDSELMPDSKQMLEVLSQMVFEIQVRTICQHAWCSISHNLFYKRERSIDKNVERDFYAINGLFYVADTHFEMINNEIIKNNRQKNGVNP